MIASAAQRARFVGASVATAAPAKLLTMLYDRLVLDLVRAEAAQRSGDRFTANAALVHAQEVVLELAGGLRPDPWEGGPALAELYRYFHRELVAANVAGDPRSTASCRSLIEPLRDAWHAAALEVAAAGDVADAVTGAR